ncbi:MAG: hypothetical protein IPP27_11395 [Bacteroidetes bacterium]|nr:hypothetical protein [Bacteroidota bacterium]MBP7306084.1 hypothetical protein [Saprospiraceae bacterium]
MRKVIIRYFYLILPLLLLSIRSSGQGILIDRGIYVNGLWCFPLISDSAKYLFLPSNPHLALDSKKRPQFSFVRYVKNVLSIKDSGKSITEAEGGAVLHFVITYDTPQDKIDVAQEELRQITRIHNVSILGPVIFKEGRFTLISSILSSEKKGALVRSVISTGEAPVLEGGRIALSFEMDPSRSKLLLESFKMNTPDVSVIFEMTFEGLSDAYDAKLKVNWNDVYSSEMINQKTNILFVSNDVSKTYNELRKNQAVELVSSGSDERMEIIVDHAYRKLTEMLFAPIDPEKLPKQEQLEANEKVNSQIDLLGIGSLTKALSINSNKLYQLKEFKYSGNTVLNFNSRLSIERYHTMVFNMGDLFKKYGDDIRFFRDINMDDPTFQQREILINIDGDVMPEFDKIIDNVTVILKKNHEQSIPTIQELNLTKKIINEKERIEIVYGNSGDKDREKWLQYDYKAVYAFKGGRVYETDWITQNSAVINLHPHYERRVVQLDGDIERLKKNKVRAVSVQINYIFMNEIVKTQQTIRIGKGFEGNQFELTLPKNNFDYNYKITWILEDGNEREIMNKGSSGILFVDNIPIN